MTETLPDLELARIAGRKESIRSFVERELEDMEWEELRVKAKIRDMWHAQREAKRAARLHDPDVTLVSAFPEQP